MKIEIEAFYAKYGPMVLRRCRWILKNEEQAHDAMQDVFVQLMKNQNLYGKFPSSLLYTIATNICLNILRHNKIRSHENIDENIFRISQLEEPEDKYMVSDLIKKLFNREKESTRTIAFLHYVDGYTLEEVAKQVNLSVSGVRKRLRQLKENSKNFEEAPHGF